MQKKKILTNIPLIDLRTIENILEEKNKILAKQCLIYMEKKQYRYYINRRKKNILLI